MKSQKGSVTVIGLVMLLFLLIMGGAWLIMMTQEKANAMSDQKQQQAWYAAEAGLKRALVSLEQKNDTWDTFTTAYNKLKTNDETQFRKIDLETLTTPADTKTRPWYAVSIVTSGGDDLNEAPATGSSYTITSVGEYMGERKVIKREFAVASSGGDTPVDPGTPTTPVTVPDGFVAAGGTITINGSWNIFNRTDSKNIFVSRSIDNNGSGNSGNGTNAALQKYWKNSNGVDNFAIYAYMPASMFTVPSKAKTQYLDDYEVCTLATNAVTSLTSLTTYNGGTKSKISLITGGNNSTLYITEACAKTINGITGPSSGEPLTIICNGNISLSSLAITGNVRILAKGTFSLTNASSNSTSNLMFLSDSDMTIGQSFGNESACLFLSSYTTINILGSSIIGRMQANNNINFTGNGITYTYSDAVLGTYSLPDGLTTGPS